MKPDLNDKMFEDEVFFVSVQCRYLDLLSNSKASSDVMNKEVGGCRSKRICGRMRASLRKSMPRSPRSSRMIVKVGREGVELRKLPVSTREHEKAFKENGGMTLGEYMVEVGKGIEKDREERSQFGERGLGVGRVTGDGTPRSLRTIRFDVGVEGGLNSGLIPETPLPRPPLMGELIAEIPYEVFGYAGVSMNLMTEATLALEFRAWRDRGDRDSGVPNVYFDKDTNSIIYRTSRSSIRQPPTLSAPVPPGPPKDTMMTGPATIGQRVSGLFRTTRGRKGTRIPKPKLPTSPSTPKKVNRQASVMFGTTSSSVPLPRKKSGRPPQSAFKNPVPSMTPSIYMTFISFAPGFWKNRKEGGVPAVAAKETLRADSTKAESIVRKADEKNRRYRRHVSWNKRGRRKIRKFLMWAYRSIGLGRSEHRLKGRDEVDSVKLSDSVRRYRDTMEVWGGKGEGERFLRAVGRRRGRVDERVCRENEKRRKEEAEKESGGGGGSDDVGIVEQIGGAVNNTVSSSWDNNGRGGSVVDNTTFREALSFDQLERARMGWGKKGARGDGEGGARERARKKKMMKMAQKMTTDWESMVWTGNKFEARANNDGTVGGSGDDD
ncbi:hypothetical protein TrCOL_g8114 [Triparma columacea]|uniref:Uncharacterized protein n=1 Tax=Triparma columacea TaxID=722753 RepID=A0A9W7GG45_9STRA|nr:hypothetical protein TrCOL_g8114 [Triparma columacea]